MAKPSSPPPSSPPPRTLGVSVTELSVSLRDLVNTVNNTTFEEWLNRYMIGITIPYYDPNDIVKPITR